MSANFRTRPLLGSSCADNHPPPMWAPSSQILDPRCPENLSAQISEGGAAPCPPPVRYAYVQVMENLDFVMHWDLSNIEHDQTSDLWFRFTGPTPTFWPAAFVYEDRVQVKRGHHWLFSETGLIRTFRITENSKATRCRQQMVLDIHSEGLNWFQTRSRLGERSGSCSN